MCEKCWGDAYHPFGRETQYERYKEIVAERDAAGTACTPKERAGQFWDEARGCDSRAPSVEAGEDKP